MSQQSRVVLARWIRCDLAWSRWKAVSGALLLASAMGSFAGAVELDPQVTKAMGYKPRQANVAYDQVSETDLANCVGKYETKNGVDGLTIYGPNGQILRRFNDSNNDRQVDQWCYYKDGIEVYRDVDSDFNTVADQYRWLGTNGTRWGIDKNEDGKIDSWKMISAEEVTIELVEAIRTNDRERYNRLLVSDQDIEQIGLSDEKKELLKEQVAEARKGFGEFVKSQKLIQDSTKWAHFAADKPGVIPAGTDGAASDIIAYENVISIVDNEGASQQLMVGSLVQVQGAWKLIDLPKTVGEGSLLAESGFFFPASGGGGARALASTEGGAAGMSNELQTLLADLEKVDTQLSGSSATGAAQSRLHDQRAQTLIKLISATKGTEEMGLWVRQFVDSVSSASMQGEYPQGLETLQSFEPKLAALPGGKELLPYVAYRVLNTDYQLKCLDENVNFAKLQGDHMENLEEYADKFGDSPDAADAMIQIALNHELSGNEKDATTWYQKVSKNFPSSSEGRKASGAIARLSLEGRTFSLTGKTLDGQSIDTKQFAGTPVLVQYWASWCDPCKKDMERIRNELARNPRGFQVVGINLDSDRDTAAGSLPAGLAPWPHIHEGNGFESDSAVGLGVLSVPVTILIDGKGTVVKRSSHFSQDMEDALHSLLERSGGPRGSNAAPVVPPATANARPGTAPNARQTPAANNRPAAPQQQQQQRPAPSGGNRAPQRPTR